MNRKKLTAENGRPVSDNRNVQTAGPRGPLLVQDPWFIENSHISTARSFRKENARKGSGAFGVFTVTHDITRYTRASVFSHVGKQTECFVRFSTVAGERVRRMQSATSGVSQ